MSKISELALALHQKTMQKKMKWDIQDDDSILSNIGQNSVTISRFFYDDRTHFSVSVGNIVGNIVDEETFHPDEHAYKYLSEMMIRARRDALRADETLDEIMEKVKQL